MVMNFKVKNWAHCPDEQNKGAGILNVNQYPQWSNL